MAVWSDSSGSCVGFLLSCFAVPRLSVTERRAFIFAFLPQALIVKTSAQVRLNIDITATTEMDMNLDDILFPTAEHMDRQQQLVLQHDWMYDPAYTGIAFHRQNMIRLDG